MLARFPRLVAISILALLLLAWLFRGSSAPSFPGKSSYISSSNKQSAAQQPEGKLRDTYSSSRKQDPDRVHPADVPDDPSAATTTSEGYAVETKFPVISRKTPFAYVLWATSDIYACSALILLRRFSEFKSPHRVHILVTDGVSLPYRNEFEKWNATIHDVEPPVHPSPSIDTRKAKLNETSEMNLMKLHVFRMHQIDASIRRAIIMDADQFLYSPIDTLFGLPEVDLAAPRAYWNLENKGGVTFNLASSLMLVEPNDRIWNNVNDEVKKLSKGEYADTVINRVFGETAMILPGTYGTVDDHWYNWWMPKWYRPEEAVLGKGMVEEYHKGEMKEIWRVINLHVNDPHDEVVADGADGSVDIDFGLDDASASAAAASFIQKRRLSKRQEETTGEEEVVEEGEEDLEEDEGDLGEVLTPEEAEKEKEELGAASGKEEKTTDAEADAEEEEIDPDASADAEKEETAKDEPKEDSKEESSEDAKDVDGEGAKKPAAGISGAGKKPPTGDEPKPAAKDISKLKGNPLGKTSKEKGNRPSKEEMIKMGLLKNKGGAKQLEEELEAKKKKEQEDAERKKKEEADQEKAREDRKKEDESKFREQSENRKEPGPQPHTVEDHPDRDALTKLHSQVRVLKYHAYGKPWDHDNPGMRKELDALAHKRLMDQNKDWREKAHEQCPRSPRRKDAGKEPEKDENGEEKEPQWEDWHPVNGV